MMTLKQQLFHILQKSREAELAFITRFSDGERAYKGTFEKWGAKDNLAHANYWADLRTTRIHTWIHGGELDPVPQYEDANPGIFEQFSKNSWEEIEAFAEAIHVKVIETVQDLDEAALSGPSLESEERKLWDAILGVAYTHKLSHYTQYYIEHEQKHVAAQLWKEWVELVSPLDAGPDWQGGVHYNAACSLALTGDRDGALEALKLGLELRPGLKGWSRLDSDLAALHDESGYKQLFAPAYWWRALEASPQVEALADQFLRALLMLRDAVRTISEDEWRKGDSLYQRPAGLALHIIQSVELYSATKLGESSEDPLTQINWQERESSKLPSPAQLLTYLDQVEQKLANFLVGCDLQAREERFPWTGLTVQSRVLYSLRHAQHHLADLAMELQHRGYKPPDWQ
jgi:hypothetical protein